MQIIRVAIELYQNANIRIKTNSNEYAENIKIIKWISQETVWPIPFSWTTFDTIKYLENKGHAKIGEEMELDMVIIANNWIDMQEKVNVLRNYCRKQVRNKHR